MKGDEKPITLRGIVIPVDWDEKGKVVAVGILARDEQEYLVDKDHKGQELLHCIQEEVEVSGVARANKDKKILAVQKYILTKV